MIYMGYLSGAIYLNTFMIITQKKTSLSGSSSLKMAPVKFPDQEIALNLVLIGMDLG